MQKSGKEEPQPPGGSRMQGRFPQTKERPQGGYRLIPLAQIAAAWFCSLRGHLRTADMRVFLACHEAVARRCTLPAGKAPKFTQKEILGLCGGTERRLKASLRRLEAAGLLAFSESEIRFAKDRGELSIELGEFQPFLDQFPNHKRLLPVPRRILRLLAGGARASLIATVLGHLVWGLYGTGQGSFKATGRLKASWIAETFGVDLRRVKEARRELVELGWLMVEECKQWEKNRWGAKFRINLAWSRTAVFTAAPATARQADSSPPPAETEPPELPPPPAVFGPESPPPVKQELPRRDDKNQKPAAGGPTGFQIKHGEEQKNPGPPALKHIVPEDLKETERLLALHAQAVASELIGSSESDRLRFCAAAEHARVIGSQNPCGLFARLVRAKLWHYLTQDDEDTANRRLKAFLFGTAPKGSPALTARNLIATPPPLSADAILVRAVRAAATRARYRGDAFPLLRREKPEWTRERWDQAVRELEGGSSAKGTFERLGSMLSGE